MIERHAPLLYAAARGELRLRLGWYDPAMGECLPLDADSGGPTLPEGVRVTYVLPDAATFPECWPVLREVFGAVRPAAMMLSAGLADPRMKIEIEVTARKRSV